MSSPVAQHVRRLGAGLALVALPLGAVAGCGSSQATGKESAQSALQRASRNLLDSGATSIVVRFDDRGGAASKAATSGDQPLTPAQADLLLGGTVSMTIDPAAGTTLRDLQAADPALAPAEQVKLVNVSLSVQADGGALAQLRLVGGDLYVNASLDRISAIAGTGGSPTDVGGQLDQLAAQSPGELAPLVRDVRAGRWIKLPLARYADRLAQLQKGAAPSPSASVDPKKLSADLLAAVRPFVAVTEASGDGRTRVLDVKVQAKQALKAVLASVMSMLPAVPGLSAVDPSGIDRLADGTVDGTVTLADNHLTKLTLDLASASRLAAAGGSPAPDLTGSSVTVDVDDSAPEVTVPGDVSGVDVGALVEQFAGALGGVGLTG